MTTILSIFGLFSMNVATPVSAASLTLSVPTDALKLDLQPNNTFSKSSASSVSVKTDAFAGYTLSIKAKSSNDLVNGSNKISSITGNLTEDQYKASGNTNTWGYQPSKINGSANASFLPGPTTSPSTIEKTSAKNDTANNYNMILGAKIDSTLPNGTYANTFVFTATANTVSYNITYELNQGTWSGASPQTGNTVDNTVKLDGNTPAKSGYEFKGWCNQQTSNENCGGISYQPGADFPLNNNNNTLTLWAMWKTKIMTFEQAYAAAGKSKQGSYYKMQDMTSDICNNVTAPSESSTTTLIDTRDSNTYTVAKLKDGKCWMTQNLRIGSNSQQTVLNSTTSDVASNFTLPAGTTKKGSTTDKTGWHYQQYNTSHIYINSNTNYGGYYTWFAATAGEGTESKSSGDTSHSICPKGWRLPTSTESTTLTQKYDTTTKNNNPPNFGSTVGAGVCDEVGCPRSNGSDGYWWSATANGSTGAYVLDSFSTLFGLGNGSKGDGLSVRCVARNK